MFKILIYTSLIFCCSKLIAQENLNFYKVPQLEIIDLNRQMTSTNLDFGFNNKENIANSIEIGYYIWIEDSWYKVANSDDVFNSISEFPLYFTIKKNTNNDLQVKGRSGSVYSFPIEGISNYQISDLDYKNGLNQLDETKSNEVIVDNEISFSEVNSNALVSLEKASSDTDVVDLNTNEPLDLMTEDNFVSSNVLVENLSYPSSNNQEVDLNKMFPKNAFKMAVSSGYKGNEIDWILDLDTKSNNSIYELAQNYGFNDSYYEWIKAVIGKDGQIDYANDVNAGFQGSFKSWIEIKIKVASDLKNHDQIKNVLVVPNLSLPLSNDLEEVLEFDLFAYYNQYFGDSLDEITVKREDLEYEITWYDSKQIEMLEVVDLGIIRYKTLDVKKSNNTLINIRYLKL